MKAGLKLKKKYPQIQIKLGDAKSANANATQDNSEIGCINEHRGKAELQ